MSQIVSPWAAPSKWETLDLQAADGTAIRIPGVVTVKLTQAMALAVNKSPQSEGAAYVMQGMEPANLTITVRLSTDQEWSDWCDVYPTIMPQISRLKDGTLRYFTILHPAALSAGVTNIIITEIAPPAIDSPGGPLTATIKAKHYLPIKRIVVAPISAPIAAVDPKGSPAGTGTVRYVPPPSKQPLTVPK
jgi:hypothetical protein